MIASNPFGAAGRAVKVQKLSVIIDRAFDALNIALPEERYERVAAMGNPGWASAAAQAQVPFPSEATKEDVIALYGMRVKAAFDQAIAESIAGALKSAGGGRCPHLNREHVGPGHRDRCNDCGATSYVRSHDARIEWEAAR